MSKLGKPANFTAPAEAKDAGKKLFGHILYGNKWEPVDQEANYEEGRAKYDDRKKASATVAAAAAGPPAGAAAKPATDPPDSENMEGKYWNDWKKIDDADEAFKNLIEGGATWKDAVEATETFLPEPTK